MPSATRTRLLIVDDELSVRTALELAMPEDFEVTTAESGEHALELVRRSPFDLALVDKNLPGISGLELLRRMKLELPDPPWAVLITGFASVQSAVDGIELGIRAYIEKPFKDVFDVVREVERLAELRSSSHAPAAEPPVSERAARALRCALVASAAKAGDDIAAVVEARGLQVV
ncbi:MAG: response regulator, partial [Myxococcales bacterium]